MVAQSRTVTLTVTTAQAEIAANAVQWQAAVLRKHAENIGPDRAVESAVADMEALASQLTAAVDADHAARKAEAEAEDARWWTENQLAWAHAS